MAPNTINVSAIVKTGEKQFPYNWTNGQITFKQIVAPRSSTPISGFHTKYITGSNNI